MPTYVRYLDRYLDQGVARSGEVRGETIVPLDRPVLSDPALGAPLAAGVPVPLDTATLLPPIVPGRICCVGLNYRSHLGDRPAPSHPELFLKPGTALAGPGQPILLPSDGEPVEAEGEVVIVIGRRARHVPVEHALACVFGVTAGNDVSARPWQANDLQWWRAKGSDTFAVLGPAIVTGLDPTALRVETRINGQVQQQGDTSDCIFGIAEIVAFASRAMTLEPGDVIYTGTPGTAGRIRAGDVVEVEVAGVGVLRSPVQMDPGQPVLEPR